MRRIALFILLFLAFTFYAIAQPTISSVSPVSGIPGNSVTITGTGYNTTTANNIVYFGAVQATVNSASSTSLNVTVPAGATYMPVSVNNITTNLTGYSDYPFLPTFNNSAYLPGNINFDPKISLITGSTPQGIAIGDLDGDGKPDLIVANLNSNTISIYRNISTSGAISLSSFASKVDLVTGTGPTMVLIADIDGDGKPEIAVLNGTYGTSNSVSVYYNMATSGVINSSSFAPRVDFATGSNPLGMAIGDIDGDGKPDMAITNCSLQAGNTVSVFHNTSTAGAITSSSFASYVNFATGTGPEGVAIGDLDGDGKPDMAVANVASGTISILRNTSTVGNITGSSFASKVDFSAISYPTTVTITDIDGDGKPDLVASLSPLAYIAIYRNTTTSGTINSSSFAPATNFPTYSQGRAAVGDINGDGKVDLVVTNFGSNIVSTFLNTSTVGAITSSSFASGVNFTSGTVAQLLAIGDLDGDGKPEIVVSSSNGGVDTLAILHNDPLSVITGTTVLCAGSTTALSNTTAAGVWSSSNNGVASVGYSTGIVTGVGAGTVTISYTVAGGVETTIMTINPAPNPGTITGSGVVYTGQDIIMNTVGSGGAWSSSNTGIASIGSGTGIVNGITAGTASISYTASNSCGILRATYIITVTPLPTLSGGTNCVGSTLTVTSGLQPTQIVWEFGGVGISTVTSTIAAAAVTVAGNGVQGGTANELYYPNDVFLDGSGNIYVADVNNHRVQKWAPGATSGITVAGTGSPGSGANQLCSPNGIYVDGPGNLYIAEECNARVTKWAPGATAGVLAAGTPDISGSGPAQFDAPTGVWVDGSGNLYVADQENNRIQKWAPGATSGTTVAGTGIAGSGAAQLSSPGSVYGDASGNIYIADESNNRIQKWAPGATAGTTVAGTGTAGSTATQLNSPAAVYVDGSGNLYIADWENARIQKWMAGATAGITVAGNMVWGSTANELNAPSGVYVDGSGNIYVADARNSRVQEFEISITNTLTATSAGSYSAMVTTNAGAAATNAITVIGVPTVSSLSTSAGYPSSSVTINGNNFNTTGANDIVYFGATQATVSTASATSLNVIVPAGATYMPVSVDNTGCTLTGYSEYPFLPTYNNSAYLPGVINFDAQKVFATGPDPFAVAMSDLDGDGKPDIIVTNAGTNTISIIKNTTSGGAITSGSFATQLPFTTGNSPYSVATGDLDGDGKPDIVVASQGGNTVSIIKNTTSGGAISFAPQVTLTSGNNTTGVAIGDLDGDGKPDIVVVNNGNNTVSIIKNTTSGGAITSASFAAPITIATSTAPWAVAIADIDGDGLPDVVVTNQGSNSVSIIKNTTSGGAISFAAQLTFATGTSPYGLAIGDLNGDGKPDIAVANNNGGFSTSGTVSVLRNTSSTGSVSFATQVAIATGSQAWNVSLSDIDGDGKPDMAVTTETGNGVVVFRNTSSGATVSFAAPTSFAAGSFANSVAIGDLDGDGKPDLVITNESNNTISILRNDPLITSISGATSVCSAASITLSDVITGGVWNSSNTAIATVGSSSGVVTGVAAGTTIITYSALGGIAIQTINIIPSVPGAINGLTTVINGALTTLTDVVTGGTWSSSNPGIAAVGSASGTVTAVAAGTSTISYTISNSCGTSSATVVVSIIPTPVIQNIYTYAGNHIAGYSGDGGTATSAKMNAPNGVAVDGSGNVYIADLANNRIRKVTPTGVITTFAGNGTAGYSGDGGLATAAELNNPTGVTVDGSGNVFIADRSNARIRKVNTSGIISTVAGNGIGAYTSDGGLATSTGMDAEGVAVDASGNIYIADNNDSRVRKVNTSGIITTIAGTGSLGYNGDGILATAANLLFPIAIAVDGAGNVYITDVGNYRIRKVNTSGIISTVAGNGVQGYNGDGGPATSAEIAYPNGLAIDGAGNLYIADNRLIREVLTSGFIITIAGNSTILGYSGDGGPATSAEMNGVVAVAVDNSGNKYIADETNEVIRVVGNPPFSAIEGTGDVCVGSSVTLIEAATAGTWGSSNTTIASVGSSTGTVTGMTTGTVTITFTLTGGTAITTIVTVSPSPATITGTMNVCTGATTTLADATTGGMWSTSNSSVAVVGSSTHIVIGVTVGTAIISYILPTGCTSTSIVTVNALPTVAGTSVLCTSSTTTLSDESGGTGTWASSSLTIASVGSTTGIITGVAAGTANITYTNSLGCKNNTVVTIDALLAAISGTASVCTGLTTTLTDATTGGTWSALNTNASVGTGAGLVTGGTAGTDVITYTLATGCIKTTIVTVNQTPAAISGNTGLVCASATMALADAITGGTWMSSATTVATVATTGIVTGVASGTSIISYTLGSCRAVVVVTAGALPAVISGTASVCTGLTTTLTNATTGGTWSALNTNASVGTGAGLVTGGTAGTDVITYTLATGCIKTAIVTVNQTPAGISGNSGLVCASATMALADGITGGMWMSSATMVATIATTGIVTGVASGTSIISYTLGSCRAVVVVTAGALPAVISGTASVCTGLTTTLTDATTGGTWSALNTNASVGTGAGLVTGGTAGTDVITYTLATGCIKTAIVTVNQTPAAISGNSGLVCASSTMALADGITGGTWMSSAATVATIATTGIVTGVASGTSIISYTLGGCRATVVVTAGALPAVISGTASMCTGLTTTLTDATTGGTWSTAGSNASIAISSSGITMGVSAGTAVITYALTTGCIKTATVTVNQTPAAISGNMGLVCASSTIALTDAITGGTWMSSATMVATVATTGIVTGVASGTSIISYTLGSCRAVVVVTAGALPAVISGTASVCTGLTTTLTDATTGGTWSALNTNANVGTGAGVVTGGTAGTDVITYTLPTGCIKTATVTVNQTPAAISGNMGLVCASSTIALTDAITGGTWMSSATMVATVATTGIVTGVASGTSIISYTLGSCRATTVVTAGALPAVISGTASVCTGLTTTLTDATTGGTWSALNTNASVGTGAGLVTGGTAGTDVITYTLATGCIKTAIVTVNQTPAGISGNSGLVCASATMALADGITGGMWMSSATMVATVATTGIVTGVASGTSIISYTLGSCRATVVVTAGALPAVISGTASVCTGLTTTLTDATTGGTWSALNTNASVGTGAGLVTGGTAGTDVITYTLATGCIKTATVTVNQTPAAISGNSGLVCASATMALADGITGGTWMSSVTTVATVAITGIVTGVASGTSIISYTLGSCRATVVVTAGALPAVISGTASVCTGAITHLSDATTGGVWSINNSAVGTIGATGVVTGTGAGNTTVSYTSGAGCYKTIVVTVNPLPNAGTLSGPSSVAVGGEITSLTLTGGMLGGAFMSSNASVASVGSSTGIVTGLATGTTSIVYTVTNGCGSANTSLTVDVTPGLGRNASAIVAPSGSPQGGVTVFPNPTYGSLTVKAEVAGIFYLYSIEGKEIGEYKVSEGETLINLPNGLAAGIYMGRYKGEDGSVQDVKLVYQP